MKNRFSLDDMYRFCVLAAAGSYRQAAAQLSMPVSTLSRRISQLEDQLQVRLLHRDAHHMTLTESGRQYFERCAPLVEELQNVSRALHDDQHGAQGSIRISAPVDISLAWLGEVLNMFTREYPKITLDLNLSNRNIDLPEHSVDLAVRVGEQQDSDWIQRHLVDIPFAFYCAPQQTQWQTLESVQQLDDWPLVLARPVSHWSLVNRRSGDHQTYRPGRNIRVGVDNMTVAARSVAAGLGVSLLPWTTAEEFCQRGELVEVASDWQGEPRKVCMLYRDRDNQPLRLQLLIDFILPLFRAEQPLPASLDNLSLLLAKSRS